MKKLSNIEAELKKKALLLKSVYTKCKTSYSNICYVVEVVTSYLTWSYDRRIRGGTMELFFAKVVNGF